jgi:mannosyltransferase
MMCLDTDTLSSHIDSQRARDAAPVVNADVSESSKHTALIGILAVALLLRVLFLGKSLWLDEGIAVGNAWAGGLPLTCWREWCANLWSHSEFNMVLYFAALRFWLRSGQSEAWIRLLSVVPAVVTVPIVYAIGRRLFDRRTAIVAALLLAVHGTHITYSQEARGYTLVVFFCAASTYLFLRGVETRRWKFWVLYALTAILGIYSHLFAVLIVVSHWLSLWWFPKRSVPWAKLIASSVAIVFASAPMLYFAAFNRAHQVEWIPKLGASRIVNTISELAGGPAALPAYLVLWVLAGISCRRAWRNHADPVKRWHTALLVSWAVAPLLITIVVSFRRPMLVPRYLLISAPATVLLAAAGACEMGQKWRRVTLWAAVLLSVGFVAFRYTRPKENWRGATAYVEASAQPSDAIVVVPSWSEPVFDYYRRRQPQRYLTELPASALSDRQSFVDAVSRYQRVWVVVYTRDYALHEPDTKMVMSYLGSELTPLQHADFRMLKVGLYAPARGVTQPSEHRP